MTRVVRVRRQRGHEVRRGRYGAHEAEANSVDEEPGDEEGAEEPRIALSLSLRIVDGEIAMASRVAAQNGGRHLVSL